MSSGLMAADGTPIVSFEDVSKVYGQVRAVDGCRWSCGAGKRWPCSGPTGRASPRRWTCCSLRRPTSGRIRMFGSNPYHTVKSGRVGGGAAGRTDCCLPAGGAA